MKLCSLLLLSLAIVSCAPPYSAELNTSAGLASQMTLLGTLGPVKSPDGNQTTAIKFLPVKPTAAAIGTFSIQSGFLVSESPGNESLNFLFQDSGGNVQTSNSNQSFPLAGADPNYPLHEFDVLATTTTATPNTANIMVYLLNGASIGNNTYQLFTASLPTGPLQSATGPLAMTGIFIAAGSPPVIAAQVFPQSSASDAFNFLVTITPPNVTDGTALLAGTAFSAGTTTSSVSLPGAGSRVLYYRNQAATLSYASYVTGGQWVCYRWLPLQLLSGVANRIDAVLTDGDLISTEGGTLRIYDPAGTQVSSDIKMGGMQFCYEAYIGTTPYVFFSVSMDFPHQNWAFRVYAIPTAQLRGLKG